MRGAWDVHVSSPVTLRHWGIVLWTFSGEQTERSLWHMKWKEFKTQKGLIAEHSFDLTVLTKKLLKHHIERQAEDFLSWKKRWQQIIFSGYSNIVWMVKSGFCVCVKMRWNLEQTSSFWDSMCQVGLFACISVLPLRKLRELIQSLAITCWDTFTSSSVPSISNVQKILCSFLEELRLAGPSSQVVSVPLLYQVILVYSILHSPYLQGLTFS